MKVNASYDEFGDPYSEIIPGYEFKTVKVDDLNTKLVIKRPNGSIITPEPLLGQEDPRLGLVSIDDNGDLLAKFNNKKIKILNGNNLLSNWSAKLTRGGKYKVTSPDGNEMIATPGEYFAPLNRILNKEKDLYGNLSLQGDSNFSIRVFRKTKVVQLHVSSKKINSGFLGYINKKNPVSKEENSIEGIFFPSVNGNPAYFTTKYSGQDIVSAIFYGGQEEKKQFGSAKFFSAEEAIKMKSMNFALKRILSECNEFDIDPDDHQDYCDIRNDLNSMTRNKKDVPFRINKGIYFISGNNRDSQSGRNRSRYS